METFQTYEPPSEYKDRKATFEDEEKSKVLVPYTFICDGVSSKSPFKQTNWRFKWEPVFSAFGQIVEEQEPRGSSGSQQTDKKHGQASEYMYLNCVFIFQLQLTSVIYIASSSGCRRRHVWNTFNNLN